MIIPIYLHIFLMNHKMGVRDIFQTRLFCPAFDLHYL